MLLLLPRCALPYGRLSLADKTHAVAMVAIRLVQVKGVSLLVGESEFVCVCVSVCVWEGGVYV